MAPLIGAEIQKAANGVFRGQKNGGEVEREKWGVSDALGQKNDHENGKKIVGANKKTYIFDFAEEKKMAARKRFLAFLIVP